MTRKTEKAKDQSQRFIEAAREAGCSEDEADIRENMKRIAKVKTAPQKTLTAK
jgi:hypothetical protein